jgi:hypothetical protein
VLVTISAIPFCTRKEKKKGIARSFHICFALLLRLLCKLYDKACQSIGLKMQQASTATAN